MREFALKEEIHWYNSCLHCLFAKALGHGESWRVVMVSERIPMAENQTQRQVTFPSPWYPYTVEQNRKQNYTQPQGMVPRTTVVYSYWGNQLCKEAWPTTVSPWEPLLTNMCSVNNWNWQILHQSTSSCFATCRKTLKLTQKGPVSLLVAGN